MPKQLKSDLTYKEASTRLDNIVRLIEQENPDKQLASLMAQLTEDSSDVDL